jgi:hypothetical protein
MRSLGGNSTDTDTPSDPNNHMEAFLYNLGVLFCFLSALLFAYFIFLVCMTCCERRMDGRWKIARAKFVRSQLVVREWITGCDNATTDGSTDHETIDDEEAPQDADETEDNKQQETADESSPSRKIPDHVLLAHDDANSSVGNDFDDDNGEVCAICLAPFEDHERVCESNNLECQHVFHEACMISWLEKHNRCPVCRQPYLVESGNSLIDDSQV